MATAWAASGTTDAALAATAGYYSSDCPPVPLAYSQFSPPLAPGAVRLLAFFLLPPRAGPHGGDVGDGGGLALANAAVAAGDAVVAALPPTAAARLHRSTPPGLHLTLFMTSQPFALCPDPFAVVGGGGGEEAAKAGGAGGGAAAVGAPAPGVVGREVAATRALAAGRAGPVFEADCIVLAPSGALPLLLVDVGGGEGGVSKPAASADARASEAGEAASSGGGEVARLRAAARAAFPSAPRSQPSIMHVTLGRLLTPVGDAATIAAVASAAAEASRKVKGLRWAPRALAHICEEVFATVQGARADAPFVSKGAPTPECVRALHPDGDDEG